MDVKIASKWILYFLNNSTCLVNKSRINNLLVYVICLYKYYDRDDCENFRIKSCYSGFKIENIEKMLFDMEKLELIGVRYNSYGIYLVPLVELDIEIYEKEELIILNKVNEVLNCMLTSEILKYSLDQSAWINSDIGSDVTEKDISLVDFL